MNFAPGTAALGRVYWLNLAFLCAGVGIFSVATTRYLRRPALALFTLTPGPLSLLTSVVGAGFFSAWFFLNGMESALALFCFAVGLLLLSRPVLSTGWLAAGSVCMGLAVLARLDDIFIVAAILGWILWKASREVRLRTALVLLLPLGMLCAYLIYNRISVGTFLPISGATKAGLAVRENTRLLLKLFLPVITGDKPATLLGRGSSNGFLDVGYRMLQMVLPAAICLIEMATSIRRRASGVHALLAAACAGVVLKALYNFCFVPCFAQGAWYYTVSIALANVVVLVWLERLLERLSPVVVQEGTARINAWWVAAYLPLTLLTANVFLSGRSSSDLTRLLQLQENPGPALAKLNSLGGDRLLEFDDGFLSYSLNRPAAAGLGLALDFEAARAVKQGHFLDLICRRGYRVAIADPTYATEVNDAIHSAAIGQPVNLAEIKAVEFQDYRLEPAGDDGSTDGLSFYRIVPIQKH